uniref:Uncharacterized protein n=1 Tax=uncultured Nocardioidaceae bacterium TaxID=253824 RepID=A0A6J4MIB3_9ACTN|nr:MAG: hypothetical protein AVDCRST_MAG46-3255 [uncultured Nocardioidaceae bacterium]
MHIYGSTDAEYLAAQRMDDYARRSPEPGLKPPPRRRGLRRHAASRLRSLADSLDG